LGDPLFFQKVGQVEFPSHLHFALLYNFAEAGVVAAADHFVEEPLDVQDGNQTVVLRQLFAFSQALLRCFQQFLRGRFLQREWVPRQAALTRVLLKQS
jgi:hypothetical protein